MPEAQRDRPVLVVVGAGPGVGASVARRFGREGFAVGLVARSRPRLDELAAELWTGPSPTGTAVATAVATADATDPQQLRSALETLAGDLGPPTALCFSPIPDVDLIKPVLDTTPAELMASLRLNVAGAAAAVQSVLPTMLGRGRGSLLFTTGSAALRPDPDRAASAVTTTAASTYVALLARALAGTGVRVGHTVIVGPVGRWAGAHDPDLVAEDLWRQHQRDVPGPLPSVLGPV